MYRSYDNAFGTPPRIYRTPDEIRRDIKGVRGAINEMNSRLNIRELLFEIITDEETIPPEEVVQTLESLLAEAEDALSKLRELRAELSLLEEELYEVRCEIER